MRALIVKTSALGDVVLAFPVAQYLKKKFPDIELCWVVESAAEKLVRANPFVDKIFVMQSKRWRKALTSKTTWQQVSAFLRDLREAPFDFVIDLQGNSKSGLVTLLAKSKAKIGFAKDYVSEWPNLLATNKKFPMPQKACATQVREDYLYPIKAFFKEEQLSFPIEPVRLRLSEEQKLQFHKIKSNLSSDDAIEKILIAPGSAWPNKELSATQLIALLQKIAAIGKEQGIERRFYFSHGSQAEKALAEKVLQELPHASLLPTMDLVVFQNVMGEFDRVVAMDSLPLHLAASIGVPTWSAFGPSLGAKHAPNGPKDRTFQGACPYGKTFTRRCNLMRRCETGACMKEIEPDDLLAAWLQ